MVGKVSKASVDYEHPAKGMDHCRDCRYFEAPHGCHKVEGAIQPGDWCRLWKAKSRMAKSFHKAAQ
jgi:hypothetical protein